ncbi:hypothetical protein PsYK624_104980 [Phanerochaete sordida]|uniref:Uncharacterized protein n=1 Tax=Phanerochaete sordida TaxID=48140 RepID=A0A9P3LH51_9APHY|nr:hypothetical protein PsYK624_104980 [Phanerochaete sordida]
MTARYCRVRASSRPRRLLFATGRRLEELGRSIRLQNRLSREQGRTGSSMPPLSSFVRRGSWPCQGYRHVALKAVHRRGVHRGWRRRKRCELKPEDVRSRGKNHGSPRPCP